jgi:hypothetical protein
MANINQNHELTNYEQWQLENHGDVIGDISVTPEGEMYESGIEELNRLAEYIDLHSERQLWEASV